ncbi:MAG: ankyrin repeat domain-containing protein [Ekhidna sp.]|nr:ankyrin repeat domain-containing protein [Ekhidna sp.]
MLSGVADIIINITNIRNEYTPVMPEQTFSIAENAAAGKVVGTVIATDADNDNLTFSITAGNTGDAFLINAATGEISVKTSAPLDFETTPTFTLTVQVSDGDFLVSASVTVNLTDVDEGPAPCPYASPTPFITYRRRGEATLYDSMRVAISKKSLPELRRLIACNEERANVTSPNVLQFSILSLLSFILNEPDFEFSVKVAEVLLDNGADIERGGFIDRTPLENAAGGGNMPLVKFLVAKGARQKSRAMIRAVDGGDNVEIVKFLLNEGANIFTQAGVFTENILQSAAGFGHLNLVKFLVEDGRLDIDFVGKDGTPLERAARNGHLEVVKHLLDKGADIDKGIQTPLLRACSKGALAIVKELVKRGADVNKADIFGQTPLMFAVLARQSGLEVMKVLVEQGKADLKKVDNDGKTVLDFARRIKDRRSTTGSKAYIKTMIDYLVSKGAPE